MRVAAVVRVGALGAALVLGCSSSGSPNASASDAGASESGTNASDTILGGRWEIVSFAKDFDYPNHNPALDVRGDEAHFLYNSKTGNVQYFVFDTAGNKTEIPFPVGTKDVPRVAILPNGSSVVVMVRPLDGVAGAFRQEGGSLTQLPAPVGPLGRFEAAALGDQVVVAAINTSSGYSLSVQRLGASAWESLGLFSARESTISRVHLATEGDRLAVQTLEGTSTRVFRLFEGGVMRDLASPPPSEGPAALTALAMDGGRMFYLEFQEAPQQSILWVYVDGAWSEWARTNRGDALHSLAVHGGVPYALWSKSPNLGEAPTTFGVARIDRGLVTKGNPTRPDDTRFDAMDYEESHLVSRDGAMWLGYQEAGSVPIAHLLRLIPR